MTDKKKFNFFIKTYGCQMNFSESEIISGIFLRKGYHPVEEMESADLIILNTCSIRDTAANKVIGKLGQLKRLKEKNPGLIIGIGGCFAQSDGDFLREKAPYLDFIFGTYNKFRLPSIVEGIIARRQSDDYETWLDVGEYPDEDQFHFETVDHGNPVTAWIPIMRGCDNYCAYCIVPYVRGREISRDPDKIKQQVMELADAGYREIILLGQNVNSYGKRLSNNGSRKITFAALLSELTEINGIERIRFITSHPKDFSDDLIRAMSSSPKICKSLHLPVQSGSNKILKKMKRQYTREEYLDLIDKLRKMIPGIVFATDMIVGFPGEDDEDFLQTCSLLETVRYEQAYLFRFSVRTGTEAEGLEGHLSEELKKSRLWHLMEIQDRITEEESRKYKDRIERVLVEGTDVKETEGMYTGRTDSNKIVVFSGDENDIGKLIQVKIVRTTPYTLFGEKI